ncbi:MAG: hypothetical protein ACRCWF_01095 [Beijerinckiaceae bacterium]
MSATPNKPSPDNQKRLAETMAGLKSGGFLKRMFTRGSVKAIIGDKRSRCCVVGVLVLVDKSIPLDGLVTEIDSSGVMFRPASNYILDRTRAEVLLRFADRELRGRITSSTSLGYEVVFPVPMPAGSVNQIINEFGMSGMVDTAQGSPLARLS